MSYLIPPIFLVLQLLAFVIPISDSPTINAAIDGFFLGGGVVGLLMAILHSREVSNIYARHIADLTRLRSLPGNVAGASRKPWERP